MSYVAAQKEILGILAQMEADHRWVIELDNRKAVDQSDPTIDLYLKAQIVDLSGDQMDLGETPITKQYGQILLCACIREGQGTLPATEMLETAVRYFHLNLFEVIETAAAEKQRPKPVGGWWHAPAIINFWYYWK